MGRLPRQRLCARLDITKCTFPLTLHARHIHRQADVPEASANTYASSLMLAAGSAGAGPQTSQVTIGGRTTHVDVTAAAGRRDGPAQGTVIIAHGFTRDRTTMAGHAEALARQGNWVVVPDLPYLVDSRDNARALRDLIDQLSKGGLGAVPGRFVLVGFSAGGLSALLAADAPGVVGYIGLDPFDRPSGVGLDAARRLRIPAFLLRGPSSACNAYSIAEPWVSALPNLVEDRKIAGSSHCDFESPTDWLCQAVCGDADPARQALVRDFLIGAVHRVLSTDLRQTGAPAIRSASASSALRDPTGARPGRASTTTR